MKKTLSLLVLLAVSFGIVFVVGCSKKSEKAVYNVYGGTLGNYSVRVEETVKNNRVCEVSVHLELDARMIKDKGSISEPIAITGHDYDGDGRFDEIFIREKSADGYNSVYFTNKGTREWKPCSGDKDTAKPFTVEQVYSAQAQLYLAMASHNQLKETFNIVKE